MFDDDVNDPDYDIKLDMNDLKSLDILNDMNAKSPAEKTTNTETETSKAAARDEEQKATNSSDLEQDATEADVPTLDTQDSIAGVGEAVELVSDDDDDFGLEEDGILALDEVDEELKKKLKKIKPSASNTCVDIQETLINSYNSYNCTPHSTLDIPPPHSTLRTLHWTLYTPHLTSYTFHFALYTVHCTPHTTLHSPHSTLQTLHFHTLHLTLHCRPLQLCTFHTLRCMGPWPSLIFILRAHTGRLSSTSVFRVGCFLFPEWCFSFP